MHNIIMCLCVDISFVSPSCSYAHVVCCFTSLLSFRRVPAGESDAATAENSDEDSTTTTTSSWNQWDSANIIPYPKHTILPFQKAKDAAASSTSNSNPKDLPQAYTSSEGWSSATRSNRTKTVIGYYAIWQLYDNTERAKPTNMEFNKVDRVNYAFFQTDVSGNIWGTDSWADPITLL